MIGLHLGKLSLALIGTVAVSSDMFWKRIEQSFFTTNGPASSKEPFRVRGIHLTAWVAGHPKARARIDDLLEKTELTSVAIAIKEFNGDVYIPGVQKAEDWGTYRAAVPDLKDYVASLKKRGVYTIARLVVFKDDLLAKKKPEWAVKNSDGSVWMDKKGYAWADPYRREVWDYNLAIAAQAASLGFDEIQFDYIRFPSDGDIKSCRYSNKSHGKESGVRVIEDFLMEANKQMKPKGVKISICVFGLTTSSKDDMGIGQTFSGMTQWVDYVYPMVYPSHYAKGEYRIPDPNKDPYKTIRRGLKPAVDRLGQDAHKIRPYLQDFSLGHPYGAQEVRAQIMAAEWLGIKEWLLWNPRSVYTREALEPKFAGDTTRLGEQAYE